MLITSHLESLEKKFISEDSFKILILKAAGILYPVLHPQGLTISQPLAVIVDSTVKSDGKTRLLAQELAGFAEPVLDALSRSKRELQQLYANYEYELFPVVFHSLSEELQLRYLADFCGSYVCGRHIAIVLMDSIFPDDYMHLFAGTIFIRCKPNLFSATFPERLETQRELVRFVLQNYDVILKKFHNLQENNLPNEIEDEAILLFQTACEVCRMALSSCEADTKRRQEIESRLQGAMQALQTEWEDEMANTTDNFLAGLTLYAADSDTILNRHHINADEFELLKCSPLQDENFYYFSEDLFSDICTDFAHLGRPKKAKNDLLTSGILVGEGKTRKYTSIKPAITTVYGIKKDIRYIRLRKDKVDKIGCLTFAEMIQAKEGIGRQQFLFGRVPESNIQASLSASALNQHVLITGQSGSGKTFALKQIERNLALAGASVIILNSSNTHTDIMTENGITVFDVRQFGLPLWFWRSSDSCNPSSEKVEAVTEIIGQIERLGVKQKEALGKAVAYAMEYSINRDKHEFPAILEGLTFYKAETSQNLFDRFYNAWRQIKSCSSEMQFECGKLQLVDLSGFSLSIQKMLSYYILALLWQHVQVRNDKTPIFVVCDEFQNIGLYENSPLAQILREGRKFGLSLLLATQSINGFEHDEIALLQQAATKLYFKPAESELDETIRNIGIADHDTGYSLLKGLHQGECIATGNFSVGNIQINRPIKLSFKHNEEE